MYIKVIVPNDRELIANVAQSLMAGGWEYRGVGEYEMLDEWCMQDSPEVYGCSEMLFRRKDALGSESSKG